VSHQEINKDILQQLYWGKSLSIERIAKQFGTTRVTIRRAMIRYSIPRRTRSAARKLLRGEKSTCSWKGGRYKTKEGYIMVWLDPHDFFYPMAQKSSGHVLEHRLVMAKYLNRCLLPWEVVHHKNGIRDDNRIENLQLVPTSVKHLPSMRWQTELRKRDERIKQLEERVTLLEAENALLKREVQYDLH